MFRVDAVTDDTVKTTAITTINQCHARWYHDIVLPFTCNNHTPIRNKVNDKLFNMFIPSSSLVELVFIDM
jgi:hypothetical protein